MTRAAAWLAMAMVAGSLVAGEALAQSKCRFLKIVDWPVRLVGNHIVVDGAINGKTIGIVLDTGAGRSTIFRASAIRLQLPTQEARNMRIAGIGGESKVDIAIVDEFKLGEVATKDLQLYVVGEASADRAYDVLLGEDFLAGFDVEFDLPHNSVRLFQPRDCDNVSLAYWTKEIPGEVEIERFNEARPHIAFTVSVNDRPFDAILDSGADMSILAAHDAAALGVTPEGAGVVGGYAMQGVGANPVPFWSGKFASFAIGNESIPDVRIVFADLYKDMKFASTGSTIAKKVTPTQPMILGADFLRAHRTLVSHSQRRMYFTYVGGPVFRAPAAPPRTGPAASAPEGDGDKSK